MTNLKLPPVRLAALAALVVTLMVAGTRLGAIPVAPVQNPAVVLGPNVTLSWGAVAGATSYRFAVSATQGGAPYFSLNVGNVTTYAGTAGLGTYYVKVYASDATGEGPASNEVPVQVVSLFVPPTAPTNLAAFVNGTSALITWDLGTGGGSPTSLELQAGTATGLSDVGTFPIAVGTQLSVPVVASGTYFLRLVAINQGGRSPVSNEAQLVMPVGGGCSAPPARTFTSVAFGRFVQFSWAPVPGASGFRLDVSEVSGGPVTYSQTFGGATSRFNVNNAPLGTFFGKLTSQFSCGSQSTGNEVTITIDGAPPPGPRAPNPAPGQRIPVSSIAWGEGVVFQVARERPDLLAQSCVEHGGNNRFMFEVLRRLRARDNRFGLNWKRGNVGDLSQDIINYNPTDQPDEGNREPYIIDIILGHCGTPGPGWIDQTGVTRERGAIGIWTLLPYLNAGYPIVSDPQQ